MLTSVVSCKKYLDVNENPNSPTQPPINGLLTKVTHGVAMNSYTHLTLPTICSL